MGSEGRCFKDVEKNQNNLYVRAYKSFTEVQRLELMNLAVQYGGINLLGETFGQGVQDLHYGQKKPTFRVFDIYVGMYPSGRYLDENDLEDVRNQIGLDRVPSFGTCLFSLDQVLALRDGMDTISGLNIREGVVVRPVVERRDLSLGRVQLKFVSPDYKLRKGNITELQ